MKKKLLAIICVFMMMTSMTTPVMATEMTASLTDNTAGWAYDESTNTLTLTDYSSIEAEQTAYGSCQIYAEGDLNLVLKGTNTLNGLADYGIYCGGKLHISGSGTLTMNNVDTGINSTVSYTQSSGNVVVNNTGVAIETGDKAEFTGGSFSAKNEVQAKTGIIDIDSAAVNVGKLIAIGDITISDADVTAIMEADNIDIVSSTVVANSSQDTTIDATGGYVTITDSKVTAHCTSGSLDGIYCSKVTVTNSTLDILGSWGGIDGDLELKSGTVKTVADGDIGHGVEGYVTIYDGELTAIGERNGIDRSVQQYGGKVTATGKSNYGIGGTLNINAGELFATGAVQAVKTWNVTGEGVDVEAGTKAATARYQDGYYGEKYVHASSMGNINKNTDYQVTVYIGGQEIKNDYNQNGIQYESDTRTLTLNNYTGSQVVEIEDEGSYQIYADGDLNIVLKGNSVFNGTADGAIRVEGKLYVSGNGTVTMNNVTDGIKAKVSYTQSSGTVVIADQDKTLETSSAVKFTGGKFTGTGEIQAKNGEISIESAEVTAEKLIAYKDIYIDDATVMAIMGADNITIESATVVAKSSQDTTIDATGGEVIITDSDVTAHCTSGSLDGIYCWKVTVTNSTVDVLGSWGGIDGDLVLNSGTVKAVADGDIGNGIDGYPIVHDGELTVIGERNGIYGKLTQNGGKVTAIGHTNCGIYGNITLNSGEFYATGAVQAIKSYNSNEVPVFASDVDIEAGTKESTARYQDAYYGEKYLHASSLGNIDKNAQVKTTVYINGQEISEDYSAEGICFEDETNTLTLSNYTGAQVYTLEEEGIYQIYADGDLNIVLNGENAFTGTADGAIRCEGKLNVSGDGTLKASNVTSGIKAKISYTQSSGTVVLEDSDGKTLETGAAVVYTGGSFTGNHLIEVKSGNISIKSAAVTADTLQANGDISMDESAVTAAMHAYNIDIQSSTVVSKSSKKTTINATGSGNITITDSDVTAHCTCGSLSGISGGMLIVKNSTLDIQGSWQGIDSDMHLYSGIVNAVANGDIGRGIDGYITVDDGQVTATGVLNGIDGGLIQNGGEVTAIGQNRYGIYGRIEINGGEMSASGQTQALQSNSNQGPKFSENLTIKTGTSAETAAFADKYYGEKYIATAGIPVTGISISHTTLNLIKGDTIQLAVTVSPSNAANKAVNWSSSEPSVVTVDENGNVKAIAAGSATVTVMSADGGYTAACDITVLNGIPVNGISLNYSNLYLRQKEVKNIQATVSPSNAANKAVNWSSSEPSIATVDENGNVKVIASAGKTTITATTVDGGYEAVCIVTVIEGKWVKDSNGTRWQESNGKFVNSCWKEIAGEQYYFNENGYRVENKWVGDYYLDGNGMMLKNKWVGVYYVGADGKYLKNTWVDGCYLGANGAYVTGWKQIDGHYYYFAGNGYKVVNKWVGSYYLKADGTMAVNEWVDGGKSYVNASGAYVTGWLQLDGHWYYLGTNGVLQTGWFLSGGVWYYGETQTGRLYEKEWLNNTYYFKAGGAMATGWQTIDGDYYYFAESGAKVISKWVGRYYLKADGTMAVSEWVDGGKSYVNASGAYITGWLQLDGHWYYLGTNGVLQTGWILSGGIWYYGETQTGRLYEKEWLNNTYYFKEGGAMVTGWQRIDGDYYYFAESGAKVTNKWVGNYYLKANGVMAVNEWIGSYYVGAYGAWIPGYTE